MLTRSGHSCLQGLTHPQTPFPSPSPSPSPSPPSSLNRHCIDFKSNLKQLDDQFTVKLSFELASSQPVLISAITPSPSPHNRSHFTDSAIIPDESELSEGTAESEDSDGDGDGDGHGDGHGDHHLHSGNQNYDRELQDMVMARQLQVLLQTSTRSPSPCPHPHHHLLSQESFDLQLRLQSHGRSPPNRRQQRLANLDSLDINSLYVYVTITITITITVAITITITITITTAMSISITMIV